MQQQRQPNDNDSSARGTFSWLLERCHRSMIRSKAGPQRRNLRILAPRVDSPPGWESTQTVQGRCAGSVGNLLAPGFPAVWALCPSDIAIRSASPDVCLFLVSPCACLAAIGPWSRWCSSACRSRASRCSSDSCHALKSLAVVRVRSNCCAVCTCARKVQTTALG